MIKEVSHLEKLVVNVSPPKPLAPLLLVQAVLRLRVVRPLAELVHGRPDHGVGEVHLLLYTHLLSKADVAQSADMHLYCGQNFIMSSWSESFFVKLIIFCKTETLDRLNGRDTAVWVQSSSSSDVERSFLKN